MRSVFIKPLFFLAVALVGPIAMAQTNSEDSSANESTQEFMHSLNPQLQIPSPEELQSELKNSPTSEKQFIEQFKSGVLNATGSGNGGDPLALSFVNLTNIAIRVCHIDQKIRQVAPQKWSFFQKNFNLIRIRKVEFNLCRDDSSSCSFEQSFAAKNIPELNLILVNDPKFSALNKDQQTQLSLQHFMSILGISEDRPGLSTNIRIQSMVVRTVEGYAVQESCEEEDSPQPGL